MVLVRVELVLALALALALPGCASEGPLGFQRDETAPEPYYKEHRELLAGEHHKDFPVPVDAATQHVSIRAELDTRDQGLPLPGTVPASLRLALLAPNGTAIAEATLDAGHPNATLEAEDLAPGRYLARVDGFGASQPVEGEAYGASYTLVAEVLY